MAISLIAAFLLPFEVFLFSYAFLGPLHYLTEISWLHDKQYFSPKKFDWIPLALLSLAILLGAQSVMGEGIVGALEGIGLGGVMDFFTTYGYDVTFFAFGLALVFLLTKNTVYRVVGVAILVGAAAVLHVPDTAANLRTGAKYGNPYWATFALYIPTLIHVYIFTGLFVIYGALKRDSRSGYISFGFFIFCAIACFTILPNTNFFGMTTWGAESHHESFRMLHVFLLDHFGGYELRDAFNENVYLNQTSILFARFIAFAYTYHYLNWFSKTSIIQWHKVPRLRFVAVIVLWLASIGLYLINYDVGFRWLFLLSFAHVLLEFPLNHVSILGIGTEIRLRISGQKKSPS